jgi:hypothetical protein
LGPVFIRGRVARDVCRGEQNGSCESREMRLSVSSFHFVCKLDRGHCEIRGEVSRENGGTDGGGGK